MLVKLGLAWDEIPNEQMLTLLIELLVSVFLKLKGQSPSAKFFGGSVQAQKAHLQAAAQ